ncbi:matrix metalloproteinase-28 [Puntigrus tetrazona]|uniref:matrix metalloproteinase-28 n=1 Tax=Puntigrus tetrazona TaxID=1606681 RepID=UPI001C897983|nr:matrix metalloproteinase-28 [Puntigrus tetrazona]
MEASVLLPVLLCVQSAVSSPVSTAARAQGFLERYGYLSEENEPHSADEVKSAIREFQRLSQLPVTGGLDRVTLEKMSSPRCGVQDVWGQEVIGSLTGPRLRRRRSAQTGEKWHKRHLTYRIMNWPHNLFPSQVHMAVKTAFQLWSNVSGLIFQELQQGPSDIRLAFFEGEHNDGTGNAFDGPGGALAHAFFPFRGEAHFDLSERWTLNGLKGHNLFLVMAHEIGHTLGLLHSPVRHALMSPYYKKRSSNALLSWDDITAVQQLYGRPAGGSAQQTVGRALRWVSRNWQTSPGPEGGSFTLQYCRGSFDAITVGENGTVLVFQGHRFWTVSNGSVSSPLPLQTRWPGLPLAIEAAAFSPLHSKLYFFKASAKTFSDASSCQGGGSGVSQAPIWTQVSP